MALTALLAVAAAAPDGGGAFEGNFAAPSRDTYLTEYFNCFTDAADVLYSRQLRRVVVMLAPNASAACDFPPVVQFDLYFDRAQTQTCVVGNYSCGTTTQVVLQNIDLLDDGGAPATPAFAVLNISSLSHFTIVRVRSVGMQQSVMDQCFDAESAFFAFTQTSVGFSLLLTNACGAVFQALKSVRVALNSSSVLFDVYWNHDLQSNCQIVHNGPEDYLECYALGNFTSDLQTAFVTADVLFTLAGRSTEVEVPFVFHRALVGEVGGILAAQSRALLFASSVLVEVEYDRQLLTRLLQLLEASNCDKAVFRVTVCSDINSGSAAGGESGAESANSTKSANSTNGLRMLQFDLQNFDPSISKYSFACADDECAKDLKQFLELAAAGAGDKKGNNPQLQVYFDISFYADLQLITVAAAHVQVAPACSRVAVARVVKRGAFALIRQENQNAQCGVDYTATTTIQAWLQDPKTQKLTQINVACSGELICQLTAGAKDEAKAASKDTIKELTANVKTMLGGARLILQIQQDAAKDTILVVKTVQGRYLATSMIACSVGTAAVLAVVVLSALHLATFLKIIRMVQRRAK